MLNPWWKQYDLCDEHKSKMVWVEIDSRKLGWLIKRVMKGNTRLKEVLLLDKLSHGMGWINQFIPWDDFFYISSHAKCRRKQKFFLRYSEIYKGIHPFRIFVVPLSFDIVCLVLLLIIDSSKYYFYMPKMMIKIHGIAFCFFYLKENNWFFFLFSQTLSFFK